MTWLDWIMVAMAIWFVLQGLLKGVTVVLLGVLAIIVAYVASAVAMPIAGGSIARWLSAVITAPEFTPEWSRTVGFVVTFAIIYVILSLLISLLPGAKRPEMTAQILGAAVGLVKAFVASMALVGILMASPLSGGVTQDLARSLVAGYVSVIQRDGIQILRQASPIAFPPYGPDQKF